MKELLKKNINKPIRVTIYSSKTQIVRNVTLTPSDIWGGQGLLGVSIRFCSFEGANENVWHILEVHPSSPAEEAGLRSFNDYIIGADSILHESEDLFTLIESHEQRPLKLYVYNTEDDACRDVTIKPNSKWGGEGMLMHYALLFIIVFRTFCFNLDIAGSLGCGIGYGYLHRIPIRALPDDKSFIGSATMPSVGSATAMPYVPPLANTFASTNVNAVPMVPNTKYTGKSDAEIVFSGVANMNLGNQHATANSESLPISSEQTQLPTSEANSNVHFQSPTESVALSSEIVSNVQQPPISTATSLHQQQIHQSPSIFGTVPPTSIPSLNESFNITAANIQNSAQTSIYQANQSQSMKVKSTVFINNLLFLMQIILFGRLQIVQFPHSINSQMFHRRHQLQTYLEYLALKLYLSQDLHLSVLR